MNILELIKIGGNGTPSAQLHVSADGSLGGSLFKVTNTNFGVDLIDMRQGGTSFYGNNMDFYSSNGTGNGNIKIHAGTGADVPTLNFTTGTFGDTLQIYGTNYPEFVSVSTGWFKFSGNVAITTDGTQPTDSRLVLVGTDNTAANYVIEARDNISNKLFSVRNDGNVGIGTFSTSAALHIKSGASYLLKLENDNFPTYNMLSFTNGGFMSLHGASQHIDTVLLAAAGSLYTEGDGTGLYLNDINTAIYAKANGISGDTNTLNISNHLGSNRYWVNGNSNDASHYFQSTQNGQSTTYTNMIIKNNGNVGIGTETPNAKLKIIGIDSTLSNYSLQIEDNIANSLFSVRNDGLITVPGTMEFTGSGYSIVNNTNALQMGYGNLLGSGTYAASYFNNLQLFLEYFNSADSTGSLINMAGSDGSGGDSLSGSDSTYAEIIAFDFTAGHYSGMQMYPDAVKVKTVAPGFAGIQYQADYSSNYTDSSLITKGDLVNGIGGTQTFKGISSGFTGSQEVKKQAGVQTTNSAATNIAIIPTSSNEVTIIKGSVAGLDGGYTGAYGATFYAVFKNLGGTVTQVSTTDIFEKYDLSGTPTISFAISGTNIDLKVTGVSATTINWVATYEYTKVKTNL